jgi:hypothetical protein
MPCSPVHSARKFSLVIGVLRVDERGIYVCVCVSVCVCVCMYVWMYGCMDVWMDAWMDGWMDGCIYA